MTAMADAMERANIKSPADKLRDIALREMVAHANDMDATIEAIWKAVQADRMMLITLFALDYERAIRGLIYRVRSDVSYKQSTGNLKRPLDRKASVIVNKLREAELQAEREQRRADAIKQAEADREYQIYLASWQATKVGSLEINGVPVWQNSAGTVRAWLATQKRRWRVVEMLIDGLPNDGRPIEYYRKPDEVEALWRATEQD